MKNSLVPTVASAIVAVCALVFAGCETESASSALIKVMPDTVELAYGESQEFQASGGSSYSWTISTESYGVLSSRTGPRVIYTSQYDGASNVVSAVLTVTGTLAGSGSNDQYSAQATILHKSDVNDLTISPGSGIELEEGEAQTYSAAGGTGSYTWSIDDSTLGFLSSTSGSITIFTSSFTPATNNTEDTVLLTVASGSDNYTISITVK